MTTFREVKTECALCGQKSMQAVITSTSAYGWPDLDMRPPEMERSTIGMWVQTCPSCGCCCSDISRQIDQSTEVAHSDSYQQQLRNPEFPELANAFLCFSLIQESGGKYASAGLASLHAAWACDDAGYNASAQTCRRKAATLLKRAREDGQSFVRRAGGEEVIMVDLLRRSGQFELALEMCDAGLQKKPDDEIIQVLQFQKILISKQDVACHSTAEAGNR